ELCVQLACSHAFPFPLVAIADPALLRERAALLNLPLQLRDYLPGCSPSARNQLLVLPVPLRVASRPGQLDAANAPYVTDTLEQAVAGCLHGEFCALVTGPVQKSLIN